jgi:hypothetical protein
MDAIDLTSDTDDENAPLTKRTCLLSMRPPKTCDSDVVFVEVTNNNTRHPAGRTPGFPESASEKLDDSEDLRITRSNNLEVRAPSRVHRRHCGYYKYVATP